MEHELQLLQGKALELAMVKHNLEGGTSFGTKHMKWFETKDTTCGDSTCIVGSNPFSNMHVHYNVGNYGGSQLGG